MGLSWSHILIVLVVFILLFGRNKISDLMGDVAKGIKSFKQGLAEDDKEMEEDVPPTVARSEPRTLEHQPVEPAPPAPAGKAPSRSRAKAASKPAARKASSPRGTSTKKSTNTRKSTGGNRNSG